IVLLRVGEDPAAVEAAGVEGVELIGGLLVGSEAVATHRSEGLVVVGGMQCGGQEMRLGRRGGTEDTDGENGPVAEVAGEGSGASAADAGREIFGPSHGRRVG